MSRFATKLAKLVLRAFPAQPGPDYRPFDQITPEMGIRLARSAYNDEKDSGCGLLNYFDGKFKISGDLLLDLGCGFGGRTLAFQERLGGTCIGVDIDPRASIAGLHLTESMGTRACLFATAVAEFLPFTDNSFDAVLCYDVMEHVQDLTKTMAEIYRVLKPRGLLFTVFPPFFHPQGSHLEGYVSRTPYAHLFFPSRILLQAIDELIKERGDGYRPQQLRPCDRLYSLNGTTIRSFRRILEKSNFEVLQLEFLPLLNRMIRKYDRLKMAYYSWIFSPLSRVPLLQELFTHRIVAILRKPGQAADRR